jgi:hypothetical protein
MIQFSFNIAPEKFDLQRFVLNSTEERTDRDNSCEIVGEKEKQGIEKDRRKRGQG